MRKSTNPTNGARVSSAAQMLEGGHLPLLDFASAPTQRVTITRKGAGRKVVSDKKDWCTPQKYVDAVKKMFSGKIALDPCSNPYSIVKAEVEYMLPSIDGLKASWRFPTIYVNPPYGNDVKSGTRIRDWLARCAHANKDYSAEVLALVPVATNTSHWKLYVFSCAVGICFLYDTRLRFLENGVDTGKGAPMSCAMIYWGRDLQKFYETFIAHGAVVDITPLLGKRIGASQRLFR